MTTIRVERRDEASYWQDLPSSGTFTSGKISSEAIRAFHRDMGDDVYELAAERLRDGVGLSYPAREVLGLD